MDEWQQIAQIVYGTVNKVQTLAAGGFRITIDGIAPELAQAAFLMPFADAPGVTLRVTFERHVNNKRNQEDGETSMAARSKRKSRWKTREEPGIDGTA